jgi:uncharacterized protein DUF4136
MKTFRTLFYSTLLIMCCAIAAAAQTVQTDFDRTFPLASLKTYGFHQQQRGARDPLAASPINDRRIHSAIDSQLRENGLTESAQPDFWIRYFVSTSKGLDIQDNRFGIFNRAGSINVNPTTEGTLVVIFLDSKTQQEVWRGYASDTINPKDFEKDVTKSVTKLIQKFKKNQVGQK